MLKKIKKFVCGALAFLMLTSFLPSPVRAVASFTVTAVPVANTVSKGEFVAVDIKVTGGDFAAAQVKVTYDKTRLEFVVGSQRGPNSLQVVADAEAGTVLLAVVGEDLQDDSTVATLTFKTKDLPGEAVISLSDLSVAVSGDPADQTATAGENAQIRVTSPLTGAVVTVAGTYDYSGSEIKPDTNVSVTLGDVPLTHGTDYEIAGYTNNTNAGTAVVAITGAGNYTGTVTGTFTISPKSVTDSMIGPISDMTYSGASREPVITVEDGGKPLVRGTDYAVSYMNNTNAAKNNVANPPTVTITGRGNYKGTASKAFTINEAKFTGITAKGVTVKYNGDLHKITVTAPQYAVVEYSLTDGSDYSTDHPNLTEVGNHTVYYRVTSANYGTETGSAIVTIYPADINVVTEGFTGVYKVGAKRRISVVADAPGQEVTVTYSTTENGVYTSENPGFTNAGTYTVYYRVEGEGASAVTVQGAETITITPAAMNVSAQDYTTVYNGTDTTGGTPHSITVKAPDGAKIEYSTDGVSFTGTNPTYTNVGTYSVYYRVTLTNYTTVTGKAFVTITRAKQNVTSTGVAEVYTGASRSITVNVNDPNPGQAVITYSDSKDGTFTSVNPAYKNVGTYTVYYKVERANYETVTGSARVIIREAAMSVTAADTIITHDGQFHSITVNVAQPAAGYTIEYSEDGVTYRADNYEYANAETYPVYYRVTANNYITFTGKASLTITKSTITDVSVAGVTVPYDKTAKVIQVDHPEGTDVEFSTSRGNYSSTHPVIVNAGNHTIYYRVSAQNSEPLEGSAIISITKADRNLEITSGAAMTIVGSATGQIEYTCDDLDGDAEQRIKFTSSNPSVVSVNNKGVVKVHGNGTARISAAISETGNYKADAKYDAVTITAIQRPITSVRSVTGTDSTTIVSGHLANTTFKISGVMKANDTVTVTYVKHDGTTGTFTIEYKDSNFVYTEKFKVPDDVGIEYSVDVTGLRVLESRTNADLNLHDGGANTNVREAISEENKGEVLAAMENAAINNLSSAAASKLLENVEGDETQQRIDTYKNENNLKTEADNEDEKDTITLTVKIYAEVEAVDYVATETEKTFTVDIKPKYDVVLSTTGNAKDEMLEEGKDLDNDLISAPVEIVIPLPSGFNIEDSDTVVIEHTKSDGTVEYIAAAVRRTDAGTFIVFSTTSFSQFKIKRDNRSTSVSFAFDDGSVEERTYTAANLKEPFPPDEREDHTFQGWKILSGDEVKFAELTNVTDALLDLTTGLTAEPIFTENTTGPGSGFPSDGGGGDEEEPEEPGEPAAVTIDGQTVELTINEDGSVTLTEDQLSEYGGSVILGIPYSPDVPNAKNLVAVGENGKVIPLSFCGDGYLYVYVDGAGTFAAIENAKEFDDIEEYWGLENVLFVTARELFNGIDATTFGAEEVMTRGMFATVLSRLDGIEPSDYPADSFADVDPEAWFASGIEWAAQCGIVNGVGDGKFDPDAPITREQMALMMFKYLLYKGFTLPQDEAVGTFGDEPSISNWAQEAVEYMHRAGILNGRTEDNFDPSSDAKRGEVAAVFARLIQSLLAPRP